MKLTIKTTYEHIPDEVALAFAQERFDETWVAKEFSYRTIKDLKRLLALGKPVGFKSKDPNSEMEAVTTFQLEEE